MVNNTRVSGVWVSSGVGSGVGGGVSADGTVVVPRWVITVSAVILLSRLLVVLLLSEDSGGQGNNNQKALHKIQNSIKIKFKEDKMLNVERIKDDDSITYQILVHDED